MSRLKPSVAAVLFLLLAPAAASAETPSGAKAAATLAVPPEPADPDSPRACVADFLALARSGKFADAAKYLEVTPAKATEAPLLAKKLVAVLDRKAWIDLDQLAPRTEGRTNDNLAPDVDEVARVSVDGKLASSIRMHLRNFPDGPRWVFTRSTVDQIDALYDGLEDRWMREHLPEELLRQGPRGLLWWQWLALPLLLLAALVFGRLFGWAAGKIAEPLIRRTRATWDDQMLLRMRGPLTLAGALLAVRILVPGLDLYRPAQEFIGHLMRAGVLIAIFWSLLRTIDLSAQLVRTSPWGKTHPASLGVIPLGTQVLKLGLLMMAVIAVLSELGYPVASLLAGLGIGGLALALAAQKTVENLFGSVSISVDQPFRIGDFVKIDDVQGTVEFVGLRSTRVRTLDRTIVTWPNGKLADLRTENYAMRDRIRLATVLGLVYGTTAAQMRAVIEGVDRVLREHPKSIKDTVSVVFVKIGTTTLDVEVIAAFETTDFAEFMKLRQEVLLTMLELVEKAGTTLAFPTHTVRIDGGIETRPPRAAG